MLNILERLLQKKERKQHTKYFTRRLNLSPQSLNLPIIINIYGPPKVGKTTWAKIFSTHFKMPLIIDCTDPRLLPYLFSISKQLPSFIKEHQIDLLILDGITPLLLDLFKLQELLQQYHHIVILIISEETFMQYDNYKLSGIDFEEYMSFSSSKNPEQLFNSFLLDGTLPEIIFTEENKKNQRKREMILLCLKQKPEILMSILPFMGQTITPHHLYTQLKKNISISKDTLYATIKQYQKQAIIDWLPKINTPNAAKKLYFWDFSLFNAISYERNFVALFENMIFLEIKKYGQSIYYSDHLDFIIKHDDHLIGILAAPFLIAESIAKKIKKIQEENLSLKCIFIITLGNTQEDKHSPLPYVMLSFWEFALGDYEI